MPDTTQYAAALSRAVELLAASPEGGEPQKDALRAFVAIAATRSASLRFYDDALTVDETLLDLGSPAFASLADRLRAHGIQELVIGRGADAAELLALVRSLAERAGQGRLKERLRDAASTRVMVIVEQRDTTRRAPSVSQAFAKAQLDEAVMADWNAFLQGGADSGDRKVNVRMSGQAAVSADAEAPPPPPAPPPSAAAPPPPPMSTAPPAPAAAAAPAGRGLAQPGTLHGVSPLALALGRVEDDPYSGDVLGRLTQLGRLVEEALTRDRVAEAIDVVCRMMELEQGATNESARSAYSVVLRRTLTRGALVLIAPYLLEPRRAERATLIMRRGADLSLDLLLGLMVAAPTLAERVAYGQVLRAIPLGADRLLALLRRDEWQVVRNVAEVVGELRIEQGGPYLGRLFQHADARVRRAALVALVKLGGAAAVEPVRHVLSVELPETRALVASAIGGAHARALVGPLAHAAEHEAKAELVREYCRALGRIGTDDAVQALAALAAPGGRLLGRRSSSSRLAAVEGLKLAASPSAATALSQLAAESDKAVREAAQAAQAAVAARVSSSQDPLDAASRPT